VAEQAHAFRSARVVVGPDGAALANLAFVDRARRCSSFLACFMSTLANGTESSKRLIAWGVIGNGKDWALSLCLDQTFSPITANRELPKKL
jgi:capsular polysaccharide biosynthesis protein